MKKRAIVAFAALWAFGCSQTPTATPERIAPLLEGIGELHHEITTSNAEAQRYFDQGLSLLYGFNHLEAIRSFEQAALLDPDCAMCFWGQALAHGPNINDPAPDAEREQKAYAAIERALALAAGASEPESAAIEALAPRYAAEASDRAALNAAYAEAMTALHESYPDDPDFSTLYVAALMNTTPWDYSSPECWDLFTEVLAVEYGNVSLFRQIHEFTVDGYAVEHPGGNHPVKSIGIHLCGLHLMLERNIPSANIPPLHQRLGESVKTWPHFPPPPDLGPVTVFDVALTGSPEEHAEKARQWASSVWRRWAPHHGAVAEIVGRRLKLD